jgi:hypothetical protein
MDRNLVIPESFRNSTVRFSSPVAASNPVSGEILRRHIELAR